MSTALASVGFRPPMRPMRATDARPSAEAKGRSAVARSPTDWYRAAGSFSRQRRTIASKAAGASGRYFERRAAARSTTFVQSSSCVSAVERRAAGEQLVEHHAERPDVRCARRRSPTSASARATCRAASRGIGRGP